MGPLLYSKYLFPFLVVFSSLSQIAFAQTAFNGHCQATSTPLQVRAEGVTERLGDIGLQCTGAAPGSVLSGNMTIYLPVLVTNRVDANNQAADAVLSFDAGSGFVSSQVPAQVSGNSLSFYGISLPSPAGSLTLRISGIRGDIGQFGAGGQQPVIASISSSLPVNQAQLVVAYPQVGLTATLYSTGITCVGSPSPTTTFTMANLFSAGTAFASTRLTEGYAGAFEPRQAGADNGVRFLVKYAGFPASAHVYVPDAVAGSDAFTPTAGGDLGVAQAVGQYVPGSGTLLLVRVNGATATGSGGAAVFPPQGSGPQALNSVSEVTLTGGAGYVVYEVVDANPGVQESSQFPTFITLPNVTAPATASETVSMAPVSAAPGASTTAPVVRFTPTLAPSDCTVLRDCGASYFPKLMADATPVQLTAYAKGGIMTSSTGYITVRNAGGGLMVWNVVFSYETGNGWLFVDYPSGVGNASVRVWSDTMNLGPGTYHATITINGGNAGTQTVPVTLTVSAPPPAPTPTPLPVVATPAISGVVNAATFGVTPLVAGSLATVKGTHFAGKNVAAAFDGVPAAILYTSDSQVNLRVPAALSGKTSAKLVVTVDGVDSAAMAVTLSPAWPAVFPHGVLNQDYSENTTAAGAKAGDILQIFATGIPKGAVVTGQIGDRKDLAPLYAGEAPNVPGVQQVNVAVPEGVPSGATLVLCANMSGGQAYCSAPYPLTVR